MLLSVSYFWVVLPTVQPYPCGCLQDLGTIKSLHENLKPVIAKHFPNSDYINRDDNDVSVCIMFVMCKCYSK